MENHREFPLAPEGYEYIFRKYRRNPKTGLPEPRRDGKFWMMLVSIDKD